MLLLLFTLLFHCRLLRCGEFEKAKFNEPLRTEHEHKPRRNDNFMKNNITDVLLNSNPGTDQTDQLTRQYSFLTTPLGNETYSRDNLSSFLISSPFPNHSSVPNSPERKPTHSENSGLTSLSNSPSDYIHPTVSNVKEATYTPSPTGPTPEGTSYSSPNVERSFIADHLPGFGLDSVSYPAETPPNNFDPSVAEYAKKWLQGIASSTAHAPKLLVLKLNSNLEYDYTTQGFPLAIRRNQKIFRSESEIRQFKNNTFRDQTLSIEYQGITMPQNITKNSESESKRLWHDPRRRSKEPVLHRTRRIQAPTTVTKQRLKPGLLLGKATISDIRITEDVEELEKTNSGSDESKKIMRMHKLPVMTKKKWYSDRTKVQSEQMGNMSPTTEKQILRHIKTAAPTSHSYTQTVTASTIQSSYEMAETRQEAYMTVFLIELTRLIATKEKKAVRDLVKHTDQILHGYYKSGQLHWFGQPLTDVIKKLARSLKESEIDVIQNEAANLHHMLRQRRQMLSEEVNTILEYGDRLYDDDEGKQLLEVLNDFAAYPNVTLTGYWLCNSIINNFLRPYRRLTDTRQRQHLIDSVNLALKTRFTLSGYNETSGVRSSDVRQSNVPLDETLIQTVPHSKNTRTSRIRKRKHHHRSHKRKREKRISETRTQKSVLIL